MLLDGAPGFEVALPPDSRCVRLIESVQGARKWPRGLVREGHVWMWSVPAERWREMRKILPILKGIITVKYAKEGAPA
ncbi:hypothetical protein [Chelatococcus caeni]|uniref:hypothetical protein n=1 Tax=Chelatococcus caeni TaxID=1348468 RepID=UPI00160CA667|nr:hypothetical protein [Chelatococcus caeni]